MSLQNGKPKLICYDSETESDEQDILEDDIKRNIVNCSKPIVDHSFRLTERHFPSYCKSQTSKKALRNCIVCAKNKVRRRSRYECEDCHVGLCVVPCFKIYHTQLYY